MPALDSEKNSTEKQEPRFTQEVQTNLFKKHRLHEDILAI